MKIKLDKTAGFTLIELLIVVALIGILVVVVVPVYRDYTIRGFNAAAISDLRHFKMFLEAEFAETKKYPVF